MLLKAMPFPLLLVAFVVCVKSAPSSTDEALQLAKRIEEAEALVAKVNARPGSTWTAKAYEHFAQMDDEQAKRHLFGLRVHEGALSVCDDHRLANTEPHSSKSKKVAATQRLPQHFDARSKWPECADVVDTIQNQGHCGSCWAVSSASVMSDRICIASGGDSKLNISAYDLMSCATERSFGCHGGYPDEAFQHWARHGLCTGAAGRGRNAGCKPYPSKFDGQNFECMHECENAFYQTPYEQDKHYALLVGNLQYAPPEAIMAEIMENGPVQAGMVVYRDFRFYAGGVYQHDGEGEPLAGHAVRVVGWGVDGPTKVPYWLIANSWGPSWGEHGYFRIRRGANEVCIESLGINFATPITE